MKTTVLKDMTECCGCGACEKSCPQSAITLFEDNHGYCYPKIDETLCVECNLCSQTCRQNDVAARIASDFEQKYYAVKNNDDAVRASSTSGGMFFALCDYVIKKGGIVFGVKFDENMRVVHSYADTLDGCDAFKGSKYVESSLGNSYPLLKEFILQNKTVLFSGTPCQVDGLKAYLADINCDNLILCDFICHGGLSPKHWKEYIAFLDKRYGKIVDFKFRDKIKGWHNTSAQIILDGNQSKKGYLATIFNSQFYSDLGLRESCFVCKYANFDRPSDITLGDFWGVENYDKSIDDNKGLSIVLINSAKGANIFEELGNSIEAVAVPKSSTYSKTIQRRLWTPSERNENNDKFWGDYDKYGYDYIIKNWLGYNFVGKLKYLVKKLLKRI